MATKKQTKYRIRTTVYRPKKKYTPQRSQYINLVGAWNKKKQRRARALKKKQQSKTLTYYAIGVSVVVVVLAVVAYMMYRSLRKP